MLDFQHVPIKFKGLNQKLDEKNVTEGEFVELENVQMTKTFRLQSRYGFSRIGSSAFTAVGIAAFGDSYAILNSNGTVSYPNVATTLTGLSPLIEFEDPVMISGFQAPMGFDTAFSPNYAIHLVKTQFSNAPLYEMRLRFVSLATGEGYYGEIVYNTATVNVNAFGKVAATQDSDDYLVCAAYSASGWFLTGVRPSAGGAIFNVRIDPFIGYSSLLPVDLVIQRSAVAGYDMIVATLQAGSNLEIVSYNTATGLWTAVKTYLPVGGVANFSLNHGSVAGRISVAYYTPSLDYFADVITLAGASVYGAAITGSLAGSASILSITSGDVGSSSIPVLITYQVSLSNLLNVIKSVNVSSNLDGIALHINSKMKVVGTDVYWVAAVIPAYETEPSVDTFPLSYANFAFCRNDVALFPFGVGSAFPAVWRGTTANFLLPTLHMEASKFRIPSNRVTIAKDAGQTVISSKAFVIRGTYGNANALPSLKTMGKVALSNQHGSIAVIEGLGENTSFIKGIIGSMFFIPFANTTLVAGSIPAGTYYYLLTILVTFADGTTAEVCPTAPLKVVIISGTQNVTIYAPPIGAYGRIGTSSSYASRINIYRTKIGGGVYYLAGSMPATQTTYTDSATDSALEQSPPYFAQGGILEGSIPPPAKTFSVVRNRIFVASAEEKDMIYYSTVIAPDNMPRFNEVLRIDISALGGEIMAFAELDDKIIIFKRYATYVIFGDGPDETGAGGYSVPQLIANGVGCISERSIVTTTEGVFFHSAEGIKLLDRGLNIVDIGAPVDDYAASMTMTGAMFHPVRDLVYFFSRSRTLVYDKYHQIWSSYTGLGTNAAVLYRGNPYFIRASDGFLLSESSASSTDAGTTFVCKLSTGWITLTGIQGFQRMRKFSMAGNIQANMTLVLYSDFVATAEETITVNAATIGYQQFEVKPKVQKCEAKKFTITYTNNGENWLSAFAIEAGAKRGSWKKAATKRVGG